MSQTADENLNEQSKQRVFTVKHINGLLEQAAEKASSRKLFYQNMLQVIAKCFQCPYCEISVNMQSQLYEDYAHQGSSNPALWKKSVVQMLNQAIAENKTKVKQLSRKASNIKGLVVSISVPLSNGKSGDYGGIAIVVHVDDHDALKLLLVRLESLLVSAMNLASFVGRDEDKAKQTKEKSNQVMANLAGYSSKNELAITLTNNLRNKVNCEQVSLGMVLHNRVKLLAISGQVQVPKNSPKMMVMREAMEECVDLRRVVSYQDKGDDFENTEKNYKFHKKWHNDTNQGSVVSIPLIDENGCSAVISLVRLPGRCFSENEIVQIHEMVVPYTSAFMMVERANRSLSSHMIQSMGNVVTHIKSPNDKVKKCLIALTICFFAWLLFGKMDYVVKMPSRIVSAHTIHLSTPENLPLTVVNVIGGDTVSKGDIICEFDHDSLLMERAIVQNKLKISNNEVAQALALQDEFQHQQSSINSEMLIAEIKHLDFKIEKSIIRAPFDGVIESGDLRKQIGQQLSQGQPLYVVAKANAWQLEIEVPDTVAYAFDQNVTGAFSSVSRPDLKHEVESFHIEGYASVDDHKNVYVAKANIIIDETWVKGGMEGVAKMSIDRKPIMWVIFHRMIDYARLNFWF